jgi:hypothetical protein
VTGGVASALLTPGIGIVPLGTGGLMLPKPVAARNTVAPGVVLTITVLAEEGGITPWAENKPRSAVTTPTRKGALVSVPDVTVTFSEGIPAGISKGTCTLS